MGRIKTKEYVVYDINDIKNNDELKNKILEKYRYLNVDYEWYEFIIEDWKKRLESMGFNNPDIEFSGFYSQGSGASFTCDSIDFKKFTESNGKFSEREINILDALCNYGYIEARVRKSNYNYCHEYCADLLYYDGGLKVAWTHMQKIVDKLWEELRSVRLELCVNIYLDLKKEYEHLMSDSAILETIEINGYEFDENGNIE